MQSSVKGCIFLTPVACLHSAFPWWCSGITVRFERVDLGSIPGRGRTVTFSDESFFCEQQTRIEAGQRGIRRKKEESEEDGDGERGGRLDVREA